ncbi:MAG: hypothetical protein KDI12_24810 [Anaerolineae bacterium]|nr:hypothetical protein [Caldilinea sp.]MCB0246655.1 hypothetical protein [Anaerolineae bacterium]
MTLTTKHLELEHLAVRAPSVVLRAAVIDAQRTNTSRSAVLRRWLTAGALAAGYDLEAQDGDDD